MSGFAVDESLRDVTEWFETHPTPDAKTSRLLVSHARLQESAIAWAWANAVVAREEGRNSGRFVMARTLVRLVPVAITLLRIHVRLRRVLRRL